MTINEIIQTLRDVDGVGGSFVVGEEGVIVSQDMPAYFDLETLNEVGPRVWRLLDAWSVESGQAECTVRFSENRLYLKSADRAVLCILLAGQVQMGALRTAAQMVTRRLARMRSPAAGGPLAQRLSQATGVQRALRRHAGMPRHAINAPGFDGSVQRSGFRTGNTTPGARNHASVSEPRPSKRVRIFRGQRFEY